MFFLYFLAVAFMISFAGTLAAEESCSAASASTGNGPPRAIPRQPQMVICGPNTLYMFLIAHGRSVAADGFFRKVDPGDRGLSLTELRDASSRYGLPAEVRHCTYDQLVGGCQMPLIALLQSTDETADQSTGHYVLVVDVGTDALTFVDGTSGERQRCTQDEFCRNWKGYVIVAAKNQPNWLLLVISIANLVLICWLIVRHSAILGRCTTHTAALETPTDAHAK